MSEFLHTHLALYSTYGTLFLQGLLTTIEVTILGTAGAMLLGAFIYLLSTPKYKATRILYILVVDLIRGVPLLVVLFVLYYGGPRFGLLLSAFWCGILGLTIFGCGYFSEIYRAGFNSIPIGQVEAARALCMPRVDITIRIQIPQMVRLAIPHLFNQFIVMIKVSAVLSIITVPELTKVTGQVIGLTFEVIQPYLIAGVLYWVFVELVARLGSWVERTASSAWS